jgi:Concanavalin A-like lectin/glucanases superfamily
MQRNAHNFQEFGVERLGREGLRVQATSGDNHWLSLFAALTSQVNRLGSQVAGISAKILPPLSSSVREGSVSTKPGDEALSPSPVSDRLDSWKEIALHLRRNVRTIQRWEKTDGLPIHRVAHAKRGTVFAYRGELDSWWNTHHGLNGMGFPGSSYNWRRILVFAFAIGIVMLSVVLGVLSHRIRSLKAAPSSFSTCAAPAGLFAALHAEGNAMDSFGQADGTLVSNAQFAPGLIGQAFLLDGQDGEIVTSLRTMPPEFTASAWVRFATLTHPPGENRGQAPTGDMSVLDKMNGAGSVNFAGWRLLKQHDNLFMFCLGGRDANRCGAKSNTVYSRDIVAVKNWYHLVIVKTMNDFSLYVNGKLNDQRALPTMPPYLDSDVPLRIGGNEAEGAHLNGMIDEVMIFSRPLSPREIQAIYGQGLSGTCGAPSPGADLGS